MVGLDDGSLFALFVLPEHEGRGIGRRLTQTWEVALFERHDAAWLDTVACRRAARFYRHPGWDSEVEIGGGDIRLEKRRP